MVCQLYLSRDMFTGSGVEESPVPCKRLYKSALCPEGAEGGHVTRSSDGGGGGTITRVTRVTGFN